MTSEGKRVTLGRVGKTHGVKGWLRVHSYTDPASNLADYRQFEVERAGRQLLLEIDQLMPQGDHLIGHFVGYDNPEQAQTLVGVELQVDAARLPPLQSNQYYWHQLIGLAVINREGQLLGQVARLLETGANDVLVVQPNGDSIDSHERLIPYLRGSIVCAIDLERRIIEVDWGADFLL